MTLKATRPNRRLAALLGLALGLAFTGAASVVTPASELAAIESAFFTQFQARHPSIAAGNALHAGDGRLEDFSAAAIAREVADLRRLRARLQRLPQPTLTADQRVDARILAGVIDGWLLDLTEVRSWQRNPMIYASSISDGVHNLMVMDHAPAAERLRLITSKLQQVPAFLSAAQTNIPRPPRIFAQRAATFLRGAHDLITKDLWLWTGASAILDSAALMRASAAATAADSAIMAYVATLEEGIASGVDGEWIVGGETVAARFRAEELIDLPLDRLLAIGDSALAAEQARFTRLASTIDASASPEAVWEQVRRRHPARGELVAATQRVVNELTTFVRAKQLATIPGGDSVTVAPSLPFDLGFASMHASPPLQQPPVASYFYVTDVRPEATAEQAEAWLQRFSTPSVAILAAHEAMPGHWLHSLYMRETPGRVRRIWIGLNPFPQPSSGQDGWAHYAEQLVVDEGFRADDPTYALAQSSEALTRIVRLLAGIRLHTRGWTLDDATRAFMTQAHLPEPAARREAERGSYDPTYGVYFLGKRALQTLRRDVAARDGRAFDLRRFHERVMRNGIAPWWAHRQLFFPGDTRPVID